MPTAPFAASDAPPPSDYASYDYGIVRVVPRVERGEFINVGVILFCRTRRYLDACIAFDPARLRAVAPYLSDAQIEQIDAQLATFPRICRGEGPIGALPQAERYHWLVAPRSTIIQVSPVHCGVCHEPAAALEELMQEFVRVDLGKG